MPNPLHPALVHFPIALGIALPLLALFAILRAGMGTPAKQAWLPVVVIAFLTVIAAFVTLKSGQNEEERVEAVVGHELIAGHEGNAERFLWASILGFAVSLVGVGKSRLSGAARGLSLLVMVIAALLVIWTGMSGGALVYEHGAASAYTQPASGSIPQSPLDL